MNDIEIKRSEKVFERIGPRGYFKVPKVIDSQTFHRFYALGRVEMSSIGEDNKSRDSAIVSLGNAGEARPFRDEHP